MGSQGLVVPTGGQSRLGLMARVSMGVWPSRNGETVPSDKISRRAVIVLIVVAVVLANAAFIGLGSVFNYPDVLQDPAAEILVAFRADEATIIALFVTLAVSAALLAPIAILLGRLAANEPGLWSMRVGAAAAVVQVIGLLRWPLIVPF